MKVIPRNFSATVNTKGLVFFFSIRIFLHGGELRGLFFSFHSITSTRFRHIFATLHVRWLSHFFNRTTCIYQTATRWDLPKKYYLIDWWRDVSFCLFTWWFDPRFLLQQFDTGKRSTRTRIDYHSWITSEPTKQVYQSSKVSSIKIFIKKESKARLAIHKLESCLQISSTKWNVSIVMYLFFTENF